MAMAMDAFGSVFGEAKPPVTIRMRPVLFHAHAHAHTDDVSQLRLLATDLHSLAWDRSLSLSDIDDLRDDVGIGGSCSDFLDYLKSCLSSGEVNLLFPHNGLDRVHLVATKAKGLPRITISLNTLTHSTLNDVIANFSLSLYAAFRTTQDHASREQERASKLMETLSSEKEKNEIMQKQLEALSFLDKRKATKPKLVANQVPSVSDVTQGSDQVIVPAQQQTPVVSPIKVPPAKATKRIAPVSRRARVRGALLQDTEEDVEE
ncbi:uncharacterized protein LOC127771751 [Oryza glaberrima]|uniref:uncharacterized protein LOC127771751 n=1 Tax=Oryza glaberrima TaxID=4538 RepID=UPI00224BEEE0|nr:uncharacterized protein LOC127771751 [Oryza glaberrima]